MRIEGFTYVRNGINMGYPFIQSIQSLLPLVDKIFVFVGDSTDGTREALLKLKNDKIVIIDTVWDENKRKNGEIFKEQANLGLAKISADWCFHLQADEILHENSYDEIRKQIIIANEKNEVDGILFPFLHFWGDYNHIRNTRRTHAFEIRAFKNSRNVFSYKDSQGFRKLNQDDNKETKLNVIKTSAPIFHYSYTRNPNLMKSKTNYFNKFWHSDDWLKKNTNNEDFDYNKVDRLELFTGSHPKYMKEFISEKDWDFFYNPKLSNIKFKDLILYHAEKLTGHRFFEYKNYKLIQ